MFAGGKCRNDPTDQYLKKDCYAHSSVMNLANNAIRPLMILTDTQCSAGQFMADGTLKQIGGNNNGLRVVRYGLTFVKNCSPKLYCKFTMVICPARCRD